MSNKILILSFIFITFGLHEVFSQSHRVTSAWNHLQHEEIEEAYEAIEKAVEHPRTKDDARAWFYRGTILLTISGSQEHQHLHENALLDGYESMKKARELDRRGRHEQEILQSMQSLALTFFNVGVEFYNERQFEQATLFFENYLEALEILDPDEIDKDGIFYSGYSAYMNDDNELAKKRLQELVEDKYEEEAAYAILAEIQLENNDTTAALETIEKGRAIFPASEQLIMTEVDIYVRQNRAEELIKRLEDAIEEHPENMDLKFILATAYDQIEKQEKSLPLYKQVAEARPDNFDANYNYGAILFNKGAEIANKALEAENESEIQRYEEESREIFRDALPYLERAHELDDEHLNTMISLRQIYLRLDMRPEAQRVNVRLDELYNEGLDDL